jgi:hypothetical protein
MGQRAEGIGQSAQGIGFSPVADLRSGQFNRKRSFSLAESQISIKQVKKIMRFGMCECWNDGRMDLWSLEIRRRKWNSIP